MSSYEYFGILAAIYLVPTLDKRFSLFLGLVCAFVPFIHGFWKAGTA
jgi:hypothetical protein